jgi:hypothetical protein
MGLAGLEVPPVMVHLPATELSLKRVGAALVLMSVIPGTRERCVKLIVTLRDARTGESCVTNLRWWLRLKPWTESLENNRG